MMSEQLQQPPTTEDHAAGALAEHMSYGEIVWRQFKRGPLSLFGLWVIAALFMLATLAPLLCMNEAIVARGAEGLRFPVFENLFNRLVWEKGVDIFFNLLLVMSPIYLIATLIRSRLLSVVLILALHGAASAIAYYTIEDRRMALLIIAGAIVPTYLMVLLYRIRIKRALALAGLHLILFLIVSPESFFERENPLFYRAPIRNWREQPAEHSQINPLIFYKFSETNPLQSLQAPHFMDASDAGEGPPHWLGTDKQGRDVLARLIYGTRISLTIGVVAVSIYVAIGIFLGALAGYFGGWIDILISRLIEVMMSIPTLFLILALVAVLKERSIFHIMIIIGVTGWTGVARLVRAEFLKQKNIDYVQAAVALGLSKGRIIFRHILPNAMAPVLVAATFGVAGAILTESTIAFLGLGDTTAPSWGETLNQGRQELRNWLILAPGLAIFVVVSMFNLMGEGLRDALDPKMRK